MYLYGASGHAKVIIDIIKANQLELNALFDDNEQLTNLSGYPIWSPSLINEKIDLLISIGNNEIRRKIAETLPVNFVTLAHPSAIISPTATLDSGSVVMQGAILQSDVKVGKHVIVNTAASIDHECVLADYVHVSPNSTLCGNVSVGEGTWIGAGSVILPGVTIGKWCTIGAGSVVAKDIPDFCLAVGNRCKIIKRYE